MNIEDFRNYCIEKHEVTESFPFDNSTLVFKVMNKMFALTNVDRFEFINLKCLPDKALELRALYEEIKPAYHMNKKHWNSVYVNGQLSDALILELIDHSYDLVVQSLPKKLKAKWKNKE